MYKMYKTHTTISQYYTCV